MLVDLNNRGNEGAIDAVRVNTIVSWTCLCWAMGILLKAFGYRSWHVLLHFSDYPRCIKKAIVLDRSNTKTQIPFEGKGLFGGLQTFWRC